MFEDARVAFDWAFSADGDPRTGIELASNLVDALLDARLFEECCARAAQAVDALARLPSGTVSAASEKRLRAALASASRAVREPPPVPAKPARAAQAAKKPVPHGPPACSITT
jgi:hypothetical protein